MRGINGIPMVDGVDEPWICPECGRTDELCGCVEHTEQSGTCLLCGYELQAVRPGKHQCNHCEEVALLNQTIERATTLCGELIAMIRINVMRDTFREATIEQVDEHLKPWIERLHNISKP